MYIAVSVCAEGGEGRGEGEGEGGALPLDVEDYLVGLLLLCNELVSTYTYTPLHTYTHTLLPTCKYVDTSAVPKV